MNDIITFLTQQVFVLQVILTVVSCIAGYYTLSNTKKLGLVDIQNKTIQAQQQQIDTFKEQISEQEEKITKLEHDAQLVAEALKDEKIILTVNGDRVTIQNMNEPGVTKHIMRKATTTARGPKPIILKKVDPPLQG